VDTIAHDKGLWESEGIYIGALGCQSGLVFGWREPDYLRWESVGVEANVDWFLRGKRINRESSHFFFFFLGNDTRKFVKRSRRCEGP